MQVLRFHTDSLSCLVARFGIRCLLVLMLSLLAGQTAFAQTLASATSKIGITKLAAIGPDPGKSNLLLTSTLYSFPAQQVSHICLSSFADSPPYELEVVQTPNARLTNPGNAAGIKYSAAVKNRFSRKHPAQDSIKNCGNGESELVITTTMADPALAAPGLYSDNLILMVVAE